jgi:hypothetical protein
MHIFMRYGRNPKLFYTIVILLGMLILVPALGWAQKFEITPMIGYQFGGKVQGDVRDLNIDGNVNYAIYLGYQAIPKLFVELSYTYMKTSMKWEYDLLPDEPLGDLGIHYFQIGSSRVFMDGRVQPFALGSLGATWFNPEDSAIDDEWRFSIALGGGAKVWITQKIGARLQGRLLMPISFEGVWFGTGGAGLAGSVLFQGDFSAGVVIGLGEGPQ